MSREEAYEQAAVFYRRAGFDLEAARCYRLAGAHRRAAEIYQAAREYGNAAESFAAAGLPEFGAWLLVHLAGEPSRARDMLAAPPRQDVAAAGQDPQAPDLRRRLVLARCEIYEGAAADVIRPVIADVCTALADQGARPDQVTEEWAVALSVAAARYDQAALVFAAAVRGRRYGAEQRWKAWSSDVLQAEIIVPPLSAGTAPAGAAPTLTTGA